MRTQRDNLTDSFLSHTASSSFTCKETSVTNLVTISSSIPTVAVMRKMEGTLVPHSFVSKLFLFVVLLLLLANDGRIRSLVEAFAVVPMIPALSIRRPFRMPSSCDSTSPNHNEFKGVRTQRLQLSSAHHDEAERLLELARRMRQEVAELEGKSVKQVEEEAQQRRIQQQAQRDAVESSRQRRKLETSSLSSTSSSATTRSGRFLSVPETPDEQVLQAKAAVERAFQDGITRQIVRWALVPQDETLHQQDRPWPGGAQQMYREAAGPMTRELMRILRAPTARPSSDDEVYLSSLRKPPLVKEQDVWDFDGSAIIAAEASTGSHDDVQALVFPNTDNKYTKDIAQMDRAMGPRLFLLVNPFWRNLDSWGFNLLAPKGKALAKEAIFDKGFVETYHLLQKSVQGEDCVALKAYPYDWQLYAYAESEYWPYEEYVVHLGSTPDEPTSVDFSRLLAEREEFKLSKNMRLMQRLKKKGE